MSNDPGKAPSATGSGSVAFVRPRGLEYAWDRNAEMAGEIVRELHQALETAVGKFDGHIGNFTGDGFQLFFRSIENGILCLSTVIREWESVRGKYAEKYLAGGAPLPDGRFLALSNGLSCGEYFPLTIKGAINYSGPGTFQAQRCEAGSTEYLLLDRIGALDAPGFVFIDSGTERLIRARNDFSISERLQGPSAQFLYAVWPKEKACTAVNADRLTQAAADLKEAARLYEQADAVSGKGRIELLEEAAAAYRKTLRVYTLEALPKEYAYAQYSLGKVLKTQASTLAGEKRIKKIEESAAALREALKVYTPASDPEDYAIVQNSLGNALRDQAKHLPGDEKKKTIYEAVLAHKEAGKFFTLESDPDYYAMVQNNLGNDFSGLAEFYSGMEKLEQLDEAKKAYMEALRVYEFGPYPERYSGTHLNLGYTLLVQAQLLSGQARLDKCNAAVSSCKEALRGYTLEMFPNSHAVSLTYLGNALRDAADCFPPNKRAAMLEEAVDSYERALDVEKPDSAPGAYAITQTNLAEALTAQAVMLTGLERAHKINAAAQAYKEALSIHTSAHYPSNHAKTTKKLADLNALAEQAEKEASIGRMTAQVAHDIRSPLVALDAALKHVESMPEEQRVMLRNAVNRIRDIANNLIEKNRQPHETLPGAGAAQVPEVCLLSSLVEQVIAEKRMQYGASGAVLDFEEPQAAYGVFAAVQPTEFRRLLSNLLNNAVEAIEKEGRVSVLLGMEGGYAAMRVSDNGKGIAPERFDKLGKKGVTFEKTGGSGLGLYHARAAAEGWGGKLEIISELGKGTTVSVLIPAAQAPEWFIPGLELNAGRCAVVLDDDESIHRVWRGRLESARAAEQGVELHSFLSSEKLRGWVKENPGKAAGAVYLLDYELLGSGETGLGLARALGLENRAVLVTSRNEEQHILEECRRLKIRIIPKGLSGFVPITIKAEASGTSLLSSGGLAVLIDDDGLARMNWKAAARAKGAELKVFASPAEFYAAGDIPKDARIYIDSELGDGVKGEEVAQALKDKGYLHLTLETGHPPEQFSNLPWLEVRGKEPPWA